MPSIEVRELGRFPVAGQTGAKPDVIVLFFRVVGQLDLDSVLASIDALAESFHVGHWRALR